MVILSVVHTHVYGQLLLGRKCQCASLCITLQLVVMSAVKWHEGTVWFHFAYTRIAYALFAYDLDFVYNPKSY